VGQPESNVAHLEASAFYVSHIGGNWVFIFRASS
jgi:hypothetical protein